MKNKEKILQLMSNLESENIERTRAFDKADKMGQAICAFANDIGDHKQPGYLLLGVEDDGSFSGKRITDEQLTALAGFKSEGNLLPPPSMTIYHESFDEGDVAVIEVFRLHILPSGIKGKFGFALVPGRVLPIMMIFIFWKKNDFILPPALKLCLALIQVCRI